MSKIVQNGNSVDVTVQAGQSLKIAWLGGTYTATAVAGGLPNLPAVQGSANSTADQTFGPYTNAVVIRIKASAIGAFSYDSGAVLAFRPPGQRFVRQSDGVPVVLTGVDTAAAFSVEGGGNGGSVSVPFAAAIPFTYSQGDMGKYFMTGALAFSVNATGAVDGNSMVLDVIADGVNVPTFSADFHELATSSGYSNVGTANVSGVINTLAIYRRSGTVFYSWTQSADLATANFVDVLPPTFASFIVANASPTVINVTMSEALSGALPAASAFTANVAGSARAINSIATVDSTHFNLTLASGVNFGEAVTLAYTKPGTNNLKDAAGNETVSIAATAVTNNVGSVNTPLRIGTLTAVTESGDGTAGWNYTHDGSGSGFNGIGISTLSFASTADGFISYVNGSAAVGAHFLGLKTAQVPGTFANMAYGLRGVNPGTGFYRAVTAGVEGAATNSVTGQIGDIARLRFDRTAGTILIEVARSATPTTWLNVHTFSGVPASRYYIGISMSQANLNPMLNLRGTGVS
jgi:hypothetical protein